MKPIIRNEMAIKFGVVILLFLMLQIPLMMIDSLIAERNLRQQEVKQEIARSSSGPQQFIGPLLVARYQETVTLEGQSHQVSRQAIVLPERYQFQANLNSFEKYRGIYTARLYRADSQVQGSLNLSTLSDLPKDSIESLALVVAVSDSRGIGAIDTLTLDGQAYEVEPGTELRQWPQGFHAPLPLSLLQQQTPLAFELALQLQGMGQLEVMPVGNATEVTLSSPWPHPSFIGDYLPVSSDIDHSGFRAHWVTNNFSTNIRQLFTLCLQSSSNCGQLNARQMGVSLIDPVDHYLKSHRTVNYSLLVITLIFASFFLLELFQARPIHPIQYGFVGLALALFYLLLISLSEHIGFNPAYLISALASTTLLGVYVSGMLPGRRQGGVFSACLLALYAMLFGLLQAESYALLMGSLLCFAILSLVMVITRHVNWYQRQSTSANASAKLTPDIQD
ncbi:cell envelope integrity protein CreD [Ferrimonas kyonanensis]|uniref:cell envelope integrity protein CreD n=1 Tax=Ferrimonas kyonanensis TaxID=364763 RepID=UPI0004269A5D|nr:cell envelope integrity protein CreD [Ferrimonas kyonanensis]